jgi:4,5-DOPA dioxygenase extradiol
MNGIENNRFSIEWGRLATTFPLPKAVLCISAHWETAGAMVTAMEKPRTIHDFGGFPRDLYEVQYAASGSPWLAGEVRKLLGSTRVRSDDEWGLDHGCWIVLSRMYPTAEVPIVQLSLDAERTPDEHYKLAKGLATLRRQGVLIVGSGNLVHNLGLVEFSGNGTGDFNNPFGFDWALEANSQFKKLITDNDFEALADYHSLGRAARLAVPTAEHFLPMLYAIAVRKSSEPLTWFNDVAVAGSLTMTSFMVG